MDYFILALGLFLLVYGANLFVEYAVRIAKYFRLDLVIFGAIFVAVGTSLPELGVTIDAGIRNLPEIIVGNIFGSNVANIGLILGIALLLSTVKLNQEKIHRESELMLLLSLIFLGLVYLGVFNWIYGALFLIISGFLINNIRKKRSALPIETDTLKGFNIPISSLIVAGSLAAVLFGSKLTVDASVNIAKTLGVSLRFIASTLIAIGTSLPELAVTLAAFKKKETGVAVGNIIGSNLFNITLIGGVGAMFTTLNGKINLIPSVIFVIVTYAGYLLATGKIKPKKIYGLILITTYVLYLLFLYFTSKAV